ncbi:MAG: carbohydrate kinase family protein [Thermomicrobiales bacterium]
MVVSASIAFDIIMSFGGSIADHIIPDKTHVISVSFLVDSMRKLRGGVAGNIAYSLALLGTRSTLVGSVGADFGPYREALLELGVDLSAVVEDPEMLTASAFMMADQAGNQIASFFPGPSAQAADIPVKVLGEGTAYAIVGATDPEVMRRHAREFGAAACRMIYDPAFQIVILSGEELRAGIDAAWALIGNDYEFAMIERKTGLTVDQLAATVPLVVVTYGEQGSELISGGDRVRVPAAPARNLKEPTGAGDAYRAGMTKGLLLGKELAVVGRIAGLAAVHAVEHHGPQEHAYTAAEFVARFDESYPDHAGAVTVEELTAAG